MNKRASTAVIILGVALAILPKSVPAAPLTEEKVATLARQMETDAKAWFREKKVESSVHAELKSARYDDATVQAIEKELAKPRKSDISLYIAVQFFRPFLMAKTEIIRKALPLVKNTHSKYNRYRTLRRLSKSAGARLKIPPLRPGLSAEARLRQVATIQSLREKKRAREFPVKQYNALVYHIEKIYRQLQVLADTPEQDEEIVAALSKALSARRLIFKDILASLRAASPKMNVKRASKLYEQILPAANKLRYERLLLENRGDVRITPTGTSRHKSATTYVGIELLELVNLLAPPARQPAMKVPSFSEVWGWGTLQSAKKHLRAGRKSAAARLINDVLRRGSSQIPSGSPVRAEARKLLKMAQ